MFRRSVTVDGDAFMRTMSSRLCPSSNVTIGPLHSELSIASNGSSPGRQCTQAQSVSRCTSSDNSALRAVQPWFPKGALWMHTLEHTINTLSH
jgi:hypothetical protein